MSKLSTLEALRGGAALYVFLHHSHIASNSGLGSILYFGQEAVIIFFLLSGFVIRYSSSREGFTVSGYMLARFVRIYPIFIVALVVAYLSRMVESYGAVPIDGINLIGNLLMLQDVSALKRGVFFDTYCGNSPLWSLSYEWWFYTLFALFGIYLRNYSWNAPFLISLVGYFTYQVLPNQISLYASYFYIWWFGVSLANEYIDSRVISMRGQRQALIVGSAMASLWFWPVVSSILQHHDLKLGVDPLLQFRHGFSALMFLCAAVLMFKWKVRVPDRFLGPLLFVAPISYAIYVIHQPILNVFSGLMPSAYPIFRVGGAFVVVLVLSWFLEKQFQPWVRRLLAS